MTDLQCTVTYCGNNSGGYCRLNAIHISGKGAYACSGTRCGSFIPEYSSATNLVSGGPAQPATVIGCGVTNCGYNMGLSCGAGAVAVQSGISGTECATFRNQ